MVGILDYIHHTFFVLSSGKNDRRLIYQHNNNTLKSHMILIRCFSIILPINKQKVTKYVMQRIERCNFTGELGVSHIFSLFWVISQWYKKFWHHAWKELPKSQVFFKKLIACGTVHSALFEKWNVLFSTKNSQTTCRLRGCSVLNALNLEKSGIKIHKCAVLLDFLAPFWLYRKHALIF